MVSGIGGTTRFPQCTDQGNYIVIVLDDRWHCLVSPAVLTLDIAPEVLTLVANIGKFGYGYVMNSIHEHSVKLRDFSVKLRRVGQ
jgi:hypothetical protein